MLNKRRAIDPEKFKTEITNARLPRGTSARIDRVLYGGELRSDFIRAAIEKELAQRGDDDGLE